MKVFRYQIATKIYDASSDSTNMFFDQKERYSDDVNYEKNLSIVKCEAYNGEYTIEDVTVELTVEEQIAELKAQLAETDYKAIKYAEGWITEEEYAPIRAERQAIRDQINSLEGGAN